ncbi:MAG: hypothetical protein ACE5H7_07345 [Acidiferrobacterales bacterium]
MNGKLTAAAVILLLGFSALTGCSKVNEPWDNSDYFKQERTRTLQQQSALKHRLAYAQEAGGDQPWVHAEH